MRPALSASPTTSMSACQSRARRVAARRSANRYLRLSRVTASEVFILVSPFELQLPLIDFIYVPAGFIAPCLPTKTDKLPSGSQWLHEIKHDGFRIIARKESQRVRLYSRPGNDL